VDAGVVRRRVDCCAWKQHWSLEVTVSENCIRDSAAPEEMLRRHLAARVPGAELSWQALPGCPCVSLLLLDPTYPRGPLDPVVTARLMDEPPYWAFCWASGQVLAAFLEERPQWVRGRRVLDLGCGSGVAGIAAALAGAARVIACDLDPVALAATRCNARRNGVHLALLSDLDQLDEPVDVVLVADVLYDRENLPLLARLVELAPQVLLADSRIRDFRHPGFRRLADHPSHTVPDLGESQEFNRVTLYASGEAI